MVLSELKSQFDQSVNAIVVKKTEVVEVKTVDAMTEEVAMTEAAEAIPEIIEETTPEVETGSRIMTGIVRNVITQTSHSEPNAICAASQKAKAVTHREAMSDEAVMTDAVEMIAVAVMMVEEEIIETPTKVAITTGIVHNAITQTLLLEPNAICVAKQKETVVVHLAEMTTVAVMTEEVAMVAVMTEEVAMVAVMTEEVAMVAVMTEEVAMAAEIIETPINTGIMTGNVQNVAIPISHSEPNAICVANQSAKGQPEANQMIGKAKTAAWATEEEKSRKELEIGIVQTVENQISPSEMIALVAAAQKE
jgi:hypothetical protein